MILHFFPFLSPWFSTFTLYFLCQFFFQFKLVHINIMLTTHRNASSCVARWIASSSFLSFLLVFLHSLSSSSPFFPWFLSNLKTSSRLITRIQQCSCRALWGDSLISLIDLLPCWVAWKEWKMLMIIKYDFVIIICN